MGLDGCFYYPDDKHYYSPAEFALKYEDVWFTTADGVKLHGWFLPARGAPQGTVVHFHGNAANVSAHVPLVCWLPEAGYNVLIFDYRGYGKSQGRVTREGTIIDGRAAVDYALSRPEVDDRRLFAFGQSLGGAVAIVIAAERPQIRAVVAESAFPSYRRIASLHAQRLFFSRGVSDVVSSWTISSGYDPIDVVALLAPRPLLVIAAGADEICPAELSRELYQAAAEPKTYWEVPGAVHLDATFSDPREAVRRLTACFERGAALADAGE